MKLLNVVLILFAIATGIFLRYRWSDFAEASMRNVTQENWEKISVGMNQTNVVSILGFPLERLPDDSKQEEWYLYRPKSKIFSDAEKVLVVSSFVVEFSSNKVTRTSVAYECPGQRDRRRKEIFWRTLRFVTLGL